MNKCKYPHLDYRDFKQGSFIADANELANSKADYFMLCSYEFNEPQVRCREEVFGLCFDNVIKNLKTINMFEAERDAPLWKNTYQGNSVVKNVKHIEMMFETEDGRFTLCQYIPRMTDGDTGTIQMSQDESGRNCFNLTFTFDTSELRFYDITKEEYEKGREKDEQA